MQNYLCPLCRNSGVQAFARDAARNYYQCGRCNLVFVPPEFHLPAAGEKAQYDLHSNLDEPGYRRFLQRVCHPLLERLDAAASGLDFGCGPGPVLATMLREQGHSVALYDQFYFPDKCVLLQQYDFITATEVFEHLQYPQQEIETLWSCLRSGGTLALMTKLVRDQAAFSIWHYKTDPTHIIFFSLKTFEFLAQHLQAQLEFFGSDVILLRKLV